MFENYKEMTDAEKASVKAIFKAIRSQTGDRYGNLAWGFVRGFPYRRIERSHRMELLPPSAGVVSGAETLKYAKEPPYVHTEAGVFYEHNLPAAGRLTHILAKAIPGFAPFNEARSWLTEPHPAIKAWLADPAGAIPAPVRQKLTSEEARVRHESRKVA